MRPPVQSFVGMAVNKTTFSSSGKPQAIVQPIRNNLRENGNLVPLFNPPVQRAGPSNVSDVHDHDYQGIPRHVSMSATPAGQSFSASRTMVISNSSRSDHASLVHPDPRMRAGVTVNRSGPVGLASSIEPKTSISVSERNVRPIDLRELFGSSSEVVQQPVQQVQQPRSAKIVTQFSTSSSFERSVSSGIHKRR